MTTPSNLGILRIIPFIIILAFFCSFADGKVIYVDDDNQADFDNIQAGIDDANDGDEVLVAPGQYAITEPIRFKSKAITVRSEDGPEETIIHRYFLANVGVIVIFDDGEDSNSLLEGFTIVDCPETGLICDHSSPRIENCWFINNRESGIKCFNSSPVINNCLIRQNRAKGSGGGGILCVDSSPNIEYCTIEGNRANDPRQEADEGGGIKCINSSPTMLYCYFFSNFAFVGGGIYNENNSHPTLIECVFGDNSAEENGGGMYNCEQSSPTLNDCIFEANRASLSGGGMYSVSSSPTLKDCVFGGNSAEEKGGGMYNCEQSSPTLTNCIFEFNEASWSGGGMCNAEKCSPTLTNCTFSGNSGGDGGGMFNVNSNPTITNCIFTGNSAYDGGGMANYESSESSPIVTNCTFSNNTAVFGGGMLNEFSNPSVTNCILWGNTASEGAQQIHNVQDSSATVSYSNIQSSGRMPWPGEGNIKKDPLFADEENGDYHLKSSAGRWDPDSQSWVFDDVNSPCLDTGNLSSPVAAEPYPNGITINMGAYGGTAEASKSPSGLNARYGHGTGEQNNPYLIYTVEQLNTLGNEPNDYDKNFKLMADVNMIGLSYDRAVIAPDTNDIEDGFQCTSFVGVFDGNGHRISNLTIQGESFLGLFGQLGYGATITNLQLEAVDVNGTGDYIGGLAGLNNSYISESRSTGKVRGGSNIGSLVGKNNGLIIACNGYGTVNGKGNNIGGLIGYSSLGTVLECYCKSNVSGWDYVGGLTGFNDVNGVISMNYCYGVVTGNDYVGGLVAGNYGSIEKSYSYSTVDANSYLGGLVGENHGSINNCYSRGLVTGNNDVGGLIGFNNGGSISESFWDMETSGQSTSSGGTGKTTAEMQTQTTFTDAGWDFVDETINGDEDIWWIKEVKDYPHLWWEPRFEPYQMVVSGYVDITTVYQELEGFGAFNIWFEGSLTAHPLKNLIYDCLFGQLGLDIYAFRNTYDIDSDDIINSAEIIEAAQVSLGHPIKIMITSWTPPAYLKSNSDTAGGGTLDRSARSGEYKYDRFAEWWLDSLSEYSTYGITADYISIQNQPEVEAGWDTCKFTPTETTDYAGYNIAFETVYQELNSKMNIMPKMLAPETGSYYESQEYIDALIEPDNVYGFNYHGNSWSISEMENFAAQNGYKPLFKEHVIGEDSFSAALDIAMQIHNSMVHEGICSFFFRDLLWDDEGIGLVTIDNPWDELNPGYTINQFYYALKQYSAFTDPGWHRVEIFIDSDELRSCAFISPDEDQLSIIIINTSEISVNLMLTLDNFITENSGVYRTSENENAVHLGTFDNTEPLSLPAQSITTVNLVN